MVQLRHISYTKVYGGDNIDVLRCDNCGLVRLTEYMDDADSFYRESGMRENEAIDLAVLRRSTKDDDERRFRFTEKFIAGKRVLDFGCGDGGYLIRAKQLANVVYGVELEKTVRDALVSESLECFPSASTLGEVDVITMFHVLEHLVDPVAVLRELTEHLSADGQIIIEVPNADDALLSLYDSKPFADFTYWKCHVYLYTADTLRRLAKKAGLLVGFVKHIQRYPIENHLYWLSQGKPGGHFYWSFLGNSALNHEYEGVLSNMGMTDTIVACLMK